jgi:outer membrane murein-binding lipoprotein Lpp
MFLLVAAAVVSSLHLLGQFALSRMLQQDAVAVAELWSRTGLKGGVAALLDAVQAGKAGAAREALKVRRSMRSR